MWLSHYVHRTFVYPFSLPAGGRPLPTLIVASGFAFNVLNAVVNAGWIGTVGAYATSWLADPRFVSGCVVFVAGGAINRRADRALRGLRTAGERGYKIPRGGLYEWVSCPNYLGEILEWGGWALATWSQAGLAFAVYTVANLAPRAWSHHRWYREQFPDYPAERRALIPRIL
jgi:protein-S-isoprenylcysteine O-methyltransferase Ste14